MGGEGKEKGIERMERGRQREVGKGVRGVVQFRVGITLDFRGDVATSAALFPPPTVLFLLPPSPSSLRVLCFAVSMCARFLYHPSTASS